MRKPENCKFTFLQAGKNEVQTGRGWPEAPKEAGWGGPVSSGGEVGSLHWEAAGPCAAIELSHVCPAGYVQINLLWLTNYVQSLGKKQVKRNVLGRTALGAGREMGSARVQDLVSHRQHSWSYQNVSAATVANHVYAQPLGPGWLGIPALLE